MTKKPTSREIQTASDFNKVLNLIKEDPIKNFVKAKGLMNFTPSAAQEVILKIILQQKLDPDTKKFIQIEAEDESGNFIIIPTQFTEYQIYEYLTGHVYDPDEAVADKINKINLVCGRRSGKTTISAIIAIFCAISTNWKQFLSKTPFASVLILSHSKEFSDEVLDIIKQFIRESPILKKLINKKRKQTTSAMNLSMPFIEQGKIVYSLVQIKVGAASSKTTRGVAACAVLCDEIAYWNLDESMKETDVKILKAVRPATKQFGKHAMLIKLSSPGIKQGVLYQEYEMGQKGELPPSYRVFKAPSWMMNTILPKEEFIEEWLIDQDGFDVEYRANFTDSISNFITPESIDLALQKGLKFLPPSADKSVKYFASIDAAYKADRFTFTLVGVTENRVTQYISKGWEGTRKNPVKAKEVAKWISNAVKNYPINQIRADQYSFQPLKEIFSDFNLVLKEYSFSNTYKKQIYFNLKRLIHSQQLDLLDNEIQSKELKSLIVEQSATGTIKIGHPAGGTDDFADSLAVACLEAVENQSTGSFQFEAAGMGQEYGIATDVNGVAFSAPSADMLVSSGHLEDEVVDNSVEYGIDPADGKFKHVSDFEDADDEDGMHFSV